MGVTEGHAVSKITVKGAPASSEQRKILRRALQLADRWGAPYKAKVALVEALIVESEAKNLSSSSADGYGSYGVLQGRDIYHSRQDLMDPDYQVGVFLGKGRGGKKNPKGFTGRGNAIGLSKSGMKSGDIAQAIEGSAYPDRYQGVQREAMRIVRELGGRQQSSGVPASKVSRAGVSQRVDPALRQAALQQYLAQRKKPGSLLELAAGLENATVPSEAVSSPAKTSSAPRKGNGPTARSAKAQGLSPLKELFWQGQGGVDAKDGKLVPQGFVSGHTDHVHVAAGPKTVVRLGKRAQKMGLRVGENAAFSGSNPTSGHAPNSYHYKGQAIDVSGSPKQMRAYAQYIARLYGVSK